MGCKSSFFSCLGRQRCQISSSSSSSSSPSNGGGVAIRVVHRNGHVEDLLPLAGAETSISPRHVMGITNDLLLFSSTQLRSMALGGSYSPFPLDVALHSQELYFLLPTSLFQSDHYSPLELLNLSSRLAAIASDPSTPVGTRRVGDHRDRAGASSLFLKKGRPWKPQLDAIEENAGGSKRTQSFSLC